MKWNENEINLLKENYEKGASYLESILDRDRSSIQHKLNRMGLRVSKETKSKISKENAHKRKFEDSYYSVSNFTVDINEYSAYILGLLWTDGFLLKNRKTTGITILKEDMLEINWIFEKVGNWYTIDRNRKNKKESRTLTGYNPNLLSSLISYDFDKKSYNSPKKLFDLVPEKYLNYLIRGIIDGDGCFYLNKKQYTYQLTIASTYEQDWSFYIDFFNKLGFEFKVQKRLNKKSKSSIIRLCQRQKIEDLSKWLYDGYEIDKIGLSRKYNKSLLFSK
jgi:hypothetical protein